MSVLSIDNEFLSLFLPEDNINSKEDYLEELKTYIFRIMNFSLTDLIQENININQNNINLQEKLNIFLKEKLKEIDNINNCFIKSLDGIEEITYFLNNSVKSIDEFISYNKDLAIKKETNNILMNLINNINQIKNVLNNPGLINLLQIPSVMIKSVQEFDLELYLECKEYLIKFFEDNEKSFLNNPNNSDLDKNCALTSPIIVYLKDKYKLIDNHCTNFVKNSLKTKNFINNCFYIGSNHKSKNAFNYKIYELIYELVFPISDFEETSIKEVYCNIIINSLKIDDINTNDMLYKIFVITIYQINLNDINSDVLDNNDIITLKDNINYLDKLSKYEDFINYIIYQCESYKTIAFKLIENKNAISSSKKYLYYNSVLNCIDYIFENYLVDYICLYIKNEKNTYNINSINNSEYFKKDKINTDIYYLRKSNNIITFKSKATFISTTLNKLDCIFNDNEIISNSINLINRLLEDFFIDVLCELTRLNNLLISKYFTFNRNDISRIINVSSINNNDIKSTENKNDILMLIKYNYIFIIDLITADINLFNNASNTNALSNVSFIFRTNVYNIMLKSINNTVSIIKKFFEDNFIMLKVGLNSKSLIQNCWKFKDLFSIILENILEKLFKNLYLNDNSNIEIKKTVSDLLIKLCFN